MVRGYLSLVLHTHLPFVRHPEHDRFLEEDWLYEAITETYLPLLDVFEGLVRDGVDFRVTMSLTPTLIAMLTDPLLQQRYVRHINRLIELAGREVVRSKEEPALRPLAEMYVERFRDAKQTFEERYGRDLVSAFRRFLDLGKVELVTCGATHGFLPLMRTRNAVHAQVQVAVDQHAKRFGRPPEGIWLPECGYYDGLDEILREAGLRYFFADAHGVFHASPRPKHGVYAPIRCPSGVTAFGRDMESSRQVWSSQEGYPGDPRYREFYRDVGFDLDLGYLRPYLPADALRVNLGIKYYRITGPGDRKELYDPAIARERAAEHAGHFLRCREKQVEWLTGIVTDRPPLITAPYDAELFGHWWFEGPAWLDFFLRKIAFDQRTIELVTPSEYLARHRSIQAATPSGSSWGYKGHAEFWLNESNDWIYRHLHRAEERMAALARSRAGAVGLERRALDQAARELLLAQGSDWAFIMKTGSHRDYAIRRTQDHLLRFSRLADMAAAGRIDAGRLAEIEYADNIFPDIDYRVYA